jgi:hypothetical protein
MEATMQQPAIPPPETPDHAHHWIIDEAAGPLSRGVCKRCGVARNFRNWLEEGDYITNEEHRLAA